MTFDGMWRPRRKFQHRYWVHLLLFGLTLCTTTIAGALGDGDLDTASRAFNLDPWAIAALLAHGLWYSIPILTILGAHEFGHYFACRCNTTMSTRRSPTSCQRRCR